jgi:hypothetical protein
MLRLTLRFLLPLILTAPSGLAVAQAPGDAAEESPTVETAPPTAAARGERRLAVWLGHVESDNIARAESGEVSGSYDNLGLLLGLLHVSPRLDASIDSNLEYRRYSLESIEPETVGSLAAMAEIDLVADRFSWMFSDDYSQGSMDPFSAARPGNRESLNVASTGPRLTLPMGRRTSLSLAGDYSERRYDQSTGANSDSLLYQVDLFRQATRTTRLGLVANSNEIDYTELDVPAYQIDSLSLQYDKTLARGTVTANIGTNELSFGATSNDEPLFIFEWERSLATRSQLSIVGVRQFTDTGGLLTGAGRGGTSVGPEDNIFVSADPLEEKRLSMSYALTMTRGRLTATLGRVEYRYVGDTRLDNDTTEAQLAFIRTISRRLRFGVTYNELNRDFANVGARAHDKDATLSSWVNRSLGTKFSVGFAVSRYERSGAESFGERRYEVRFGYSPVDNLAMGVVGL